MKTKHSHHHPETKPASETAAAKDSSDHSPAAPPSQPAQANPAEIAATEIASLKDQLLRARADFENTRKRLVREKDESLRYANQAILGAFLPLLDYLELGLQAASTAKDVSSVVSGMKMIQSQFERFLTEQGVTPIDALGQPFDPHWHEALSQEPAPGKAEGTVLQQRRRGYRLGDRLLRPASVVTVGPASPPSS